MDGTINKIYIFQKIKNITSSRKHKIQLEILYKTEPHLVKNSSLIKTFLISAKNVGVNIKPVTLAGNSVAKEFSESGIPSIVHYPAENISAHEPNEHIEIKKMLKTAEIYSEFLTNYFF